MSVAIRSAAYPAEMDLKLRRIRRRRCALAVIRASLLAVFALLTSMLVAMSIDLWFTLFETQARLMLTGASLLLAIATLLFTAAGPVAASLRLRRAAKHADREVPQLEERWTTVANFAESDHQPQTPWDRAMLQQVTSEAVAMGRLVEPARVARPDGLRRAAMIVAAASLVLGGFLALDWRQNRVLLQRFWSPMSDISATRLQSVTGDAVIPRGQPVDVLVNMLGLPRDSATIMLATDGDEVDAIDLSPDPEQPGAFVYHLAALEQSFRYRVQAGDGRTPWHSVTAIDRPALAEVRFTITSPEYVDRPKFEKPYLPDRARAIQGSRLKLELRPDAPLKRLELLVARAPQAGEAAEPEGLILTADSEGWYRFEAVLAEDVSLSPSLVSPHGLTNEDRPQCSISVIADRAPVAHVISPTEELAVSPDEVVEIKFEAHDDHGIARAELVVYDNSPTENGAPPAALSVQEIPLGEQQLAKHVMATAQLDLSRLGLREGANISYAVRATDNYMAPSGLPPAQNRSDASAPAGEGNESEPTESSAPSGAAVSAKSDVTPASSTTESQPEKTPAVTGKMPVPRGTGFQPVTDASSAAAPQPKGGPTSAENNDASKSETAASTAANDQPEKGSSTPPAIADQVAAAAGSANPASELSGAGSEAPATGAVGDDERRTGAPETPSVKSQGTPASTPTVGQTDDTPAQPDQQPQPESADSGSQSSSTVPSPEAERMAALDDMRGQNTESNRLRLKIAKRLASAADAGDDRRTFQIKIRERLEQIDRELNAAESVLQGVVDSLDQSRITDAQIKELTAVDERLATVDRLIADLRNESKETPLAFAGLQMVEIGSSHITPARDRVFALIHQPDADADGNAAEALHRVSRARELLAELLARYERVLREQELAQSLEEAAKMYEVYVKNMHRLLRRQSRPSANPLQRKMEIVEVDQEYLDRLRQVMEMRRDLMAEFGRMLADDPRLLGKYMDLIKRRQVSLRDDLTQLHERQAAIAGELSGWQQVSEAQREDIWMLAVELRLQEAAPMAKEASQLEERTVSQLPLGLDASHRAPAAVIEQARQLAVRARSAASQARRLMRNPSEDDTDLAVDVDEMTLLLAELDAALEQLEFDYNDEETAEFVVNRLAESRDIAERVSLWAESLTHIQHRRYHGLAKVDQIQLMDRTEQLRIAMLDLNTQLAAQFQGEVPESVQAIVRDLQQVMESVTFNQIAAAFALDGAQLAAAETQQGLALQGFELAEELFDQIRRTVVKELDQIDPDNPNVADLEDPTLDQLLQRLEREPDLNALLGLGQRPRNLRVTSDWMVWEEQGGHEIDESAEEAARRARERAEKEMRVARKEPQQNDEDTDKSDEEWQKVASAAEAQEMLQKKIEELRRKAGDPETDAAETEKLLQMAKQMEAMRQQLCDSDIKDEEWQEIVRSDQMKAMMRAMAAGEPLPDSQWNRILSSLDTGLWQVKRRTPPEEYRRAIEQYQDRIRHLMNVEAADE